MRNITEIALTNTNFNFVIATGYNYTFAIPQEGRISCGVLRSIYSEEVQLESEGETIIMKPEQMFGCYDDAKNAMRVYTRAEVNKLKQKIANTTDLIHFLLDYSADGHLGRFARIAACERAAELGYHRV